MKWPTLDSLTTIILAGGLGTRLKSVLNDRPKPMAPVGNIPFLEHLVVNLKRQGVSRFVLSTGYRGELIRQYFADGSKWNISIEYSHEKEALGTGGAIKLATKNYPASHYLCRLLNSLRCS